MSTQPLTHGTVPQRLALTRELMSREGINALLVPSADPHCRVTGRGGNGCPAFMAR
jgi:hypothetical protein